MPKATYGLAQNNKVPERYLIYYLVFVLFLSLVAMQVSTQILAYHLNYHINLGSFSFVFGNTPIYLPWKIIPWQKIQGFSEIIEYANSIAYVVFILPQLFLFLWYFKRLDKGNSTLHGSAHWANEKEIETMGFYGNEGVYVGSVKFGNKQRYLRHNGAEHVCVTAPTRSGKGVGLILPSLLEWKESSLVLDIKGENWALTSGYRQSLGHKVLRFDPTDASGSACKFNPIQELRIDTLYAVQDVQGVAMLIVDPTGKGLEDHWTKAAFAFFSGLILHCCVITMHKQQRPATLNDITLMLSGFESTIKELLEDMVQKDHAQIIEELFPHADKRVGVAIHEFISSSASEMQAKAENEASGVISSALVNMALYRDPIIALNTSESDFRLDDLMNNDEPLDLYLVLNPANIDRVRPLVRIIMDMIIRHVCKDMAFKDGASVKGYKHRLLFMLDEFTSLGKLAIIEKAIAYIAGYGGMFYLIIQDYTQLESVYGKEHAILANCHVRIAYAPNTIATANIISEMTGKTTVVDKKTSISYSKGGSSRSVSIQETARPLLTPDECMRLPSTKKNSKGKNVAGNMLIVVAGNPTIYGTQILYYQDNVFMERAKIKVPGISEKYPSGITDSIYCPRPQEWYVDNKKEEAVELPSSNQNSSFDSYFDKE